MRFGREKKRKKLEAGNLVSPYSKDDQGDGVPFGGVVRCQRYFTCFGFWSKRKDSLHCLENVKSFFSIQARVQTLVHCNQYKKVSSHGVGG